MELLSNLRFARPLSRRVPVINATIEILSLFYSNYSTKIWKKEMSQRGWAYRSYDGRG